MTTPFSHHCLQQLVTEAKKTYQEAAKQIPASECLLEEELTSYRNRILVVVNNAKRSRQRAIPHVMSAVRNQARIACLDGYGRAKIKAKASKLRSAPFFELFENALPESIENLLTEIESFWEEQDLLRKERRREQRQEDEGYILELYENLNTAYEGREKANAARETWIEQLGHKYVERTEEEEVGALVKRTVKAGKRTLTCAFWLCVAGAVGFLLLLLLCYLAFPHPG